MRLVSIITAVLVAGALYLLVMERDLIAGRSEAVAEPGPAKITQAEAPGTGDARPVPVLARQSVAQAVDNAVLLRGRTEAARSVEVRAETSGRVISDPPRRGAFVNEGETLCRLDPGTRPQALAEAEARLAEATLVARNAERLTEGGYSAETRRLSTQTALQSASSAVEAARRELDKLDIRAPFSGLIEDDAAELGALLQPGGLCARVIALDPIRLVGFVPEADVARVEVGALAGGRLASGGDVVGRVTFLARSADPLTRTFRAEVTVPNPDLAIREGQTVDVLIATEGVRAHLVPGSALTLDDAGRIGLRLVVEGRAQFAPVKVLRDVAEGIWVTGLPDTATVIVRGQDYVTDGVAVAVTMEGAQP